jgi:hypothetical protein
MSDTELQQLKANWEKSYHDLLATLSAKNDSILTSLPSSNVYEPEPYKPMSISSIESLKRKLEHTPNNEHQRVYHHTFQLLISNRMKRNKLQSKEN